jgi:hypothetical protein
MDIDAKAQLTDQTMESQMVSLPCIAMLCHIHLHCT